MFALNLGRRGGVGIFVELHLHIIYHILNYINVKKRENTNNTLPNLISLSSGNFFFKTASVLQQVRAAVSRLSEKCGGSVSAAAPLRAPAP